MLRRLLLVMLLGFVWAADARGDVFDRYTNPILGKAPEAEGVQEIKKLTADLIDKHGRLLPNTNAALLLVKTNGGMNCKLAVQAARRKKTDGTVPMALIDRYVCYKPGQERAIQAAGANLNLFDGFILNLEIGQVVPAEIGGDVRFVAEGDHGYLEPVGQARFYLITRHLPGTEPRKGEKPAVGDSFEAAYFNGTYKLADDGRRSAVIKLKVDEQGDVTGEYISDETGRKYEIAGKVSPTAKHHIQFTVKFPNSTQHFQGYMFTKDARAICGVCKMQEQEFGFYAIRAEEE